MKKTRWDDVALSGLLAQVEQMPDPRMRRKPRHLLTDILVIAICGVLSGCDGCVEIAEYGRRKEEFFRTILDLAHGIPSHDTFNRMLALLKPEALQACLIGWLRSVRDEAGDSREELHIAIDGKSLRRTFDRAASQNMLHLVSAWSTANGITLGQVAVDEKSNEITAIPQLLAAVDCHSAVQNGSSALLVKAVGPSGVASLGAFARMIGGRRCCGITPSMTHAAVAAVVSVAMIAKFVGRIVFGVGVIPRGERVVGGGRIWRGRTFAA